MCAIIILREFEQRIRNIFAFSISIPPCRRLLLMWNFSGSLNMAWLIIIVIMTSIKRQWKTPVRNSIRPKQNVLPVIHTHLLFSTNKFTSHGDFGWSLVSCNLSSPPNHCETECQMISSQEPLDPSQNSTNVETDAPNTASPRQNEQNAGISLLYHEL